MYIDSDLKPMEKLCKKKAYPYSFKNVRPSNVNEISNKVLQYTNQETGQLITNHNVCYK